MKCSFLVQKDLFKKFGFMPSIIYLYLFGMGQKFVGKEVNFMVFNSFSNQELTQLNANAKDYIRKKADTSDLFLQAEKQAAGIMDMIQFMAESAGWTVEILPRNGLPVG